MKNEYAHSQLTTFQSLNIFRCVFFSYSYSLKLNLNFFFFSSSDAQEWTGQCTTGKHQSPIEISANETVPISMNPFIFEFYSNPPKAENLTNNGHSVTFTLRAEREITYPKVKVLFRRVYNGTHIKQSKNKALLFSFCFPLLQRHHVTLF